MTECPEKFPLSWLYERVDSDDRFAAEALAIRFRLESYKPIQRRDTHTAGTSACGLINHWLVDRDLNGYERGRPVDDFAALAYIPFEGCVLAGMAIRESFIDIKRDELTALMRAEGMTIPSYLGGTGDQGAAEDAPATVAADTVMAPAPEPRKMKKAALISKYGGQWPTIANTLSDSSRNELKSAKMGNGYYDEVMVVQWAQENGKLKDSVAPTSLKMADLPRSVIKRGS